MSFPHDAANNAFQNSRQMHEAVTADMRDEAGTGLYSIDGEMLRLLAPDVIITQVIIDSLRSQSQEYTMQLSAHCSTAH